MTKPEDVDPQVMWAWVADALRPWAGWVIAIIGTVALTVGYLGVSREVLVAKQLPYVVSGGLGGIALVFIGGVLLGTQDVRRQGQRIARLESLISDLHDVLLEADDTAVDVPDPAADDTRVLATSD